MADISKEIARTKAMIEALGLGPRCPHCRHRFKSEYVNECENCGACALPFPESGWAVGGEVVLKGEVCDDA
jgi:uncharacterized protein (DUF983 family)